jgi:4'-phosphopantetheinyl transferase
MNLRPVDVLRWPAVDKAQDLLIVAVDTPDTPIRDAARQLVRAALRDILGDVELISLPGQPIRLARPGNAVGISISHETGQSLLAIHRSGPVGIDLLRIGGAHDWQPEIPLLARNYLGPKSARRIAGLSSTAQVAGFAQAWTAHEARLKCLGLVLEEWSPALEVELSCCCVQQLALPAGLVGSVATLKSGENRAF